MAQRGDGDRLFCREFVDITSKLVQRTSGFVGRDYSERCAHRFRASTEMNTFLALSPFRGNYDALLLHDGRTLQPLKGCHERGRLIMGASPQK